MPEPLDPPAIMAEHRGLTGLIAHPCSFGIWWNASYPCLPYRLAEALTAARREGAEQALRDAAKNPPPLGSDFADHLYKGWLNQRADKIAKGDGNV